MFKASLRFLFPPLATGGSCAAVAILFGLGNSVWGSLIVVLGTGPGIVIGRVWANTYLDSIDWWTK